MRRDYGDIDSLTESINTYGLLEPLVITPGGLLIAGGRRYRALERSVFRDQPVPVHIRGDIDVAIGEYLENEERKDFTLTEKVAQWREVEPLFREAAKKRQHHADDGKAGRGRLRDDMKRITGTGGRTLEKAIRIVEAAEQDPKKFGHLLAYMDSRGADGAIEQMKIIQMADRVMAGEPAPPPRPPSRKTGIDGRPHLICQEITRLLPEQFLVTPGHEFMVDVQGGKVICECECGFSFAVPYAEAELCVQETLYFMISHWRRTQNRDTAA